MSRLDNLSTRPPPLENSAAAMLHHAASKHKVSRAPMLNPYDKFTQPQFDAWIGDITGSLRRALGYEQEKNHLLEENHVNGSANVGALEYPQWDLSDQDTDPFPQIKMRRDKGKARDPREGPGLGKDRTQPIEVASSDEEEEEEVKDLAFSLRHDDPDVYNPEDDESNSSLEGNSPSIHNLSSSPTRAGFPRSRQKRVDDESNAGSNDGEFYEYEDDYGDFDKKVNDNEVISVISSENESVDGEDDEEEYQESDYHDRPGPSSFRYSRDHSSEEEELQGETAELDEIQHLDYDDSLFPPRHHSLPRNLELNDPWKAPRKYAEDFYSGGELRLPSAGPAHADHLSPLDEGVEAIVKDFSSPYEVHDQYTGASSDLRSTSEFYQDYYSEGNVMTSFGQQLASRFIAGPEDEENGMESLPTMDAVEAGFRQATNQSMFHSTSTVSPSKRNEPIPQDAEIIALDDSDDEEDALQVTSPPEPHFETVTEPAIKLSEEPEPEESLINNVGDDEVLSVHTAHTEDIGDESRLQPFEIVEPETADFQTAQERLVMAFDVEFVPSDVDLEEQNRSVHIELVEPQAIFKAIEETLSLDVSPEQIKAEVNEQAPNYYDDFDDIYETPPSGESNGIQTAEFFVLSEFQDWGCEVTEIETQATNGSGSVEFPTGNAGADVNDNTEVSSVGVPSLHHHENGDVVLDCIVPELTVEELSLQTSRNGVISEDVKHSCSSGSAVPNGLPDIVSASNHPQLKLKTPEVTTKNLPFVSSPCSPTVPGQPQIPMPVTADANVPDPTESPTRLQEHPILSVPTTPDIVISSQQSPLRAEELVPEFPSLPTEPHLQAFNPIADGLFTPADFSTVTTPAEDTTVTSLLPSEWRETESQTLEPADLNGRPVSTENSAAPPKEGVGDMLTVTNIGVPASTDPIVTMNISPTSLLLTDPYPYSLSTPINPMSGDGSSKEIDDDESIDSDSMEDHEVQMEEEQIAIPSATDIETRIPSPPTTEPKDSYVPLAEANADPQAVTVCSLNLLGGTTDLVIPPPFEEKVSLDSMELQDPSQSTIMLEDSPTILAEKPVKSSEEQLAITQPPLEAGRNSDLQALVKEIPETPSEEKESSDTTVSQDLHLSHAYERSEQHNVAQVTNVMSPASKREREISLNFDGSDPFSVNQKGCAMTKRGWSFQVEQLEHDIVPAPSFKSRGRDSAVTELAEHSFQDPTSVVADVSYPIDETPDFNMVDATQPHQPQQSLHALSLFHAHGRNKRQKAIASVKPTEDRGDHLTHQPENQHVPVPENKPIQSERDPFCESVRPTTAEASHSSVPSTEPSQLGSTTLVAPVLAVKSPTTTSPESQQPSSIASAAENSRLPHSILTTTALSPAPSLQSSPVRFLPASHPRSTRSQCKYHKITLPKGENGPRVCFLVPGCSLTNQYLIKREEIEDDGEATYEDSLRMVHDIEYLDFDQYLIGILRQLVGLDILREGEVFYLPQPGDEVHRKHWPCKSISSTAKGSDYASFAGSPGYSYSGSAHSPSTRPPLSNADSMSANTTNDESENQEASAGNISKPEEKSARKRKAKNVTLQPDGQSPDEEVTPKKRRKSGKRGIKRTRTLDSGTGNDGTRKSKRLKSHLTDPSLYTQ